MNHRCRLLLLLLWILMSSSWLVVANNYIVGFGPIMVTTPTSTAFCGGWWGKVLYHLSTYIRMYLG